MQLTSFTDYGLRALMRIAGEPDRVFTSEQIAAELVISRHHLVKIVQRLNEAGLVATRRGAGGGFRLARPAETISIGEVVRLLEARFPLVDCFRSDGGVCVMAPHCRLKRHLAAAREAFFRELDKTTLAECAFPTPPRVTAA